MRYSLVSRFQGTVQGAILGETIMYGAKTLPATSIHWMKMLVLGTESLISLGKLDLDDWQQHQQQEPQNSNATLENLLAYMMATLPLALFFHENIIKLRENLLVRTKMWEDKPQVRDGTLAVGYAIAQSLKEQVSRATLIPQIVSFMGETPTNLPEQLIKVHNLLDCQAGIERVQAELLKADKLSYTIAMAFYCFLSTLEDYRLGVLQAHQYCEPGLARITGALSGAYNSTIGIPVSWQVLAERELIIFSQIIRLTNELAAVWSGVYNFCSYLGEVRDEDWDNDQYLSSLEMIASPRVIQ
jgi:ADP-ribosylglycohydrolase